jgi:hypothetical protein
MVSKGARASEAAAAEIVMKGLFKTAAPYADDAMNLSVQD